MKYIKIEKAEFHFKFGAAAAGSWKEVSCLGKEWDFWRIFAFFNAWDPLNAGRSRSAGLFSI